jgi:hypothetical protein
MLCVKRLIENDAEEDEVGYMLLRAVASRNKQLFPSRDSNQVSPEFWFLSTLTQNL